MPAGFQIFCKIIVGFRSSKWRMCCSAASESYSIPRFIYQYHEAGFSGRNRIHSLSLGRMEAYSFSVSSMERWGEWICSRRRHRAEHDVITSRGIDSSPREQRHVPRHTVHYQCCGIFWAARSADRLGFVTRTDNMVNGNEIESQKPVPSFDSL